MVLKTIQFIGSAYTLPALQLDAQSCVNWYPTFDSEGKAPKALLPRAGLKLFADDINENHCRGALATKSQKAYVVIDNSFYIYNSNGTRIKKGTLNTSSGRVKIIANDYQIGIFDGLYGYVYQVIESETRSADIFFQIKNSSSTIEDPIFYGTGLNDLTASGFYTGDISGTYRVQIDGVGSPNTFKWSDDNGITWQATNIAITGLNQKLNKGVSIAFINVTAHTLNDYWNIPVIIDSSFYPPIIPACQEGFGIYIRQNSNRMYSTYLNDFSEIDPLAYAEANIYQDNSVGAISVQQELYILKELTTEVWNYTGIEGFPFQPRANFVINYGCAAPYSATVGSFNVLFMVARNKDGARKIVKIENYSGEVISNEPLEAELATYDTVSDAYTEIVEKNEHVFVIFTFPIADKTWVFDYKTKNWFSWASYAQNELPYQNQYRIGAFRGSSHFLLNDKDIFGDSRTGKLFEFTNNSFRDFDYPILFERVSQHLYADDNYITINSLMVDVQRAPNTDTTDSTLGAPTIPPQIGLQISRDGGMTWGSEIYATSGKVGEYAHRAFWSTLGTARVFTFKIRITDSAYNVIINAVADVEVSN